MTTSGWGATPFGQGESGNGRRRSRSSCFRLRLATGARILVALAPAPLSAQERTADNAVTQAEDAFGFSVGRESVGIYSATNTRGFSPTAAGNIRLDGLYFDPQVALTSAISNSSSIRVGLTAQGYPFAAPSGVVDYQLNRPAFKSVASVITNADSFGTLGIEVDGSAALGHHLALGYGFSGAHNEFSDGTHDWEQSESLIGRWQPAKGIELLPFWMRSDTRDALVGTQYVPGGPFLPPQPAQRLFTGPRWTKDRVAGTTAGVVASANLGRDLVVRAGLFRSFLDTKANFANLLVNERPDGSGEHLVIADPPLTARSTSGEIRISRSLAEGNRLHVVHLSVRGRRAEREFGGSDSLDLGPGTFKQSFDPAEPPLVFGALSLDRIQQTSVGVAYDGRWKNVGEVGLSIARTFYRKTTLLPGSPDIISKSSPLLYDATLAVNAGKKLILYGGYTKGLEESGVAPPNAANRNQPLPAILTEQADAGVRWQIAPGVKAVVGAFDLRRPTFGFDSEDRFVQIGTTRSRGIEFSVSGKITPRFNLLLGGVLLDPVVTAARGALTVVGRRPAGIPSHTLNASINWRTPFIKGLEFDVSAYLRGKVVGTTDNAVILTRWSDIDIGAHYGFTVARHDASVRLRMRNLLDDQVLEFQGPGVYGIGFGRYVSATLTLDT
jgi:iron complex outermembrane receptor protein